MCIETLRLCNYQSIKEEKINLVQGSTDLKLNDGPCYLGVHLDKHLEWENHIKCVVSTCYGKLPSLPKMKNFIPFSTRKMLAESLLLSKIDSNDYVYSLLKQCQLKKLHRLQKAIARFVIKRYAHTKDTLRIGWLPIAETREFNILKLTFNAIHETKWQEKNKIEFQICSRNFRSNREFRIKPSMVPHIFQDAAANSFNALPSASKTETSCSKFCGGVRQLLTDRAKSLL